MSENLDAKRALMVSEVGQIVSFRLATIAVVSRAAGADKRTGGTWVRAHQAGIVPRIQKSMVDLWFREDNQLRNLLAEWIELSAQPKDSIPTAKKMIEEMIEIAALEIASDNRVARQAGVSLSTRTNWERAYNAGKLPNITYNIVRNWFNSDNHLRAELVRRRQANTLES